MPSAWASRTLGHAAVFAPGTGVIGRWFVIVGVSGALTLVALEVVAINAQEVPHSVIYRSHACRWISECSVSIGGRVDPHSGRLPSKVRRIPLPRGTFMLGPTRHERWY